MMGTLEGHQITQIRQIIGDFALIEKVRPTVDGIRSKLNASALGVEFSYSQARRLLLEMGYR